ncbi:uncharacterized protein ACO6RY_09003 [Pungitius sinensis]
MFKRRSQLRQEGFQSLNTSTISLVTYSITHFLGSSIPYFFPCSLFLLLKNCKVRNLNLIPLRVLFSDCIFVRKQRTVGKEGREMRKPDEAKWEDHSRLIRVLIG